MGYLDEKLDGNIASNDSLYNEWHQQWIALDDRLEKLPMMERADMLFDGKLTINAISESHLLELITVVDAQVSLHEKLIKDEDEDADPEDLEIWVARQKTLKELLGSDNWRD
tara:strand:+ start:152 stop:487 length:336 start_codon:yes stop_codon:yes gene_type:complete